MSLLGSRLNMLLFGRLLSTLCILLYFTVVVLSNEDVSDEVRKSYEAYNTTILRILKDIEEERKGILTLGKWIDSRNWSPVTTLMNAAYHISIEAVKKLHKGETDIEEFNMLNDGLLSLNKRFQDRNLTVVHHGDKLGIASFREEELYHNNHEDDFKEKLSLTFLPIWGLLFNANYNSQSVILKFVEACDKYNPILIMQEYSHTFSVTAGMSMSHGSPIVAITELIRLESRAADDRVHFYQMAILFTECMALSQKAVLHEQEPRSIGGLHQYVVVALNLLQKKYLNAAGLINRHAEL